MPQVISPLTAAAARATMKVNFLVSFMVCMVKGMMERWKEGLVV